MILWKFSLTKSQTPLSCWSRYHADSGVPGVFFSSGSWSSRFCQFADRIGFCRVPEDGPPTGKATALLRRAFIFDSLVSDSQARQKVSTVIDRRYGSESEMILS